MKAYIPSCLYPLVVARKVHPLYPWAPLRESHGWEGPLPSSAILGPRLWEDLAVQDAPRVHLYFRASPTRPGAPQAEELAVR